MVDPEVRDVAAAVVRRPALWPTAALAGFRHRPRRWWRPGAGRRAEPWLRFRMETAYGDARTVPTPTDVVTFLRWLRVWPQARR